MSITLSKILVPLTVKEGWAMGLKVAITSSGEKLLFLITYDIEMIVEFEFLSCSS